MGDNPSHQSSSTLTTNSDLNDGANPSLNFDLTDSANSGRKVKLIFRTRTRTSKFCHRVSHPFVMAAHIFFQELVYAKLQLGSYSGFEGWEDAKLWDFLAIKMRIEKSLILQILKEYKYMYSIDNTLTRIPYGLKENVLMVFGSERVLKNLDVNIVEKVLQDGAASSLPLTPHPIGQYQPTLYLSSSSSGETNRVTYSSYNPAMDKLLEKALLHNRKIGDKVDVVDGVLVETEEEQKIAPSQSLPENINFMNEFGYTGSYSRRYGEDLESLKITADEVSILLKVCPPTSSQYLAIADLSAHIRRRVLHNFFITDSTAKSSNSSGPSNSSVPSKRKKST